MSVKRCRFYRSRKGCRYGDNCRYVHDEPNVAPISSPNELKNWPNFANQRKRAYTEIDLTNYDLDSFDVQQPSIKRQRISNNHINHNNINHNFLSSPTIEQKEEEAPPRRFISCGALGINPIKGKDRAHDLIEVAILNPHKKAQLHIVNGFQAQFYTLEAPGLQVADICNLNGHNGVDLETYRHLKAVLPEHNVNDECIQLTIPLKNQCKMLRVKFWLIPRQPFKMSIGGKLMHALGLVLGRRV